MHDIVIVEPAFFTQFHCVGSACPDHCCKGWDIELDKPTVNRYLQSDEIEIRHIAQENVITTEINEGSWGKIKLQSNGNCSFLDEDRLCKVHKSLGEKALSGTCAIYPRLYGSFKYEIRSNLTLSCPEAARLLLTTPGAMLFGERVRQSPELLDAPDISQEDRLIGLMCTHIMVGCGSDIEEGFYGITMLLLYRDKLAGDADLQEKMLRFFEDIQTALQNGTVKKEMAELHPDHQLQSALLLRLQSYLSTKNEGRGGQRLQRYYQNLTDLTQGVTQSTEVTTPARQLNTIWREKALPWLQARPHLLSNYIQYRLYEDRFPSKKGREPLTHLLLLMSEWLLLKWLIAASVELNPEFSEEEVINIVYSYHSITKHDKYADDKLLAEIEQIDFTDKFSLIYLLTGG